MAEVHRLEVAPKKSLFELSAETKMIYDRLRVLNVSDFVSYQDLSALIGRDTQKEGRHHLMQAVKKCLREHSMIFGTVRSEGVKRLSDQDALAGGKIYDRLTGMVNKRRTVLHALDYDKLTKAEQVEHNVELTVLGTVKYFSKQKSIARLAGAVEKSELPVAKTIELFMK